MIDVIINHLENQKLPTPGSKLFWVVTSPPPYPIREHAHKSQRPGKETASRSFILYSVPVVPRVHAVLFGMWTLAVKVMRKQDC